MRVVETEAFGGVEACHELPGVDDLWEGEARRSGCGGVGWLWIEGEEAIGGGGE